MCIAPPSATRSWETARTGLLRDGRNYGITRPLLHAERLEIQHPVTRRKTVFEAPWPADMKQAQALFRRSFKAALLALCLAGSAMPTHADDAAPVAKAKATHTSQSRTGGQLSASVKTLKSDMASLHSQFKALIEEVSALQDRVTGIQSASTSLTPRGACAIWKRRFRT